MSWKLSVFSLQSLERDELNWFIGHEVAHLVNMEKPKSGLQKAMDVGRKIKSNFFSFMNAALASGHSSWDAENPLRKAAGAAIIAGVRTILMMTDILRDSMSINAKILSLAFKRKEESRADRASILLTGDADAGIRALNILLQEENNRGLWADIPRLLTTHPHTQQRIKDLERFRDEHLDELKKSRTSLDELRVRMKRDFTAAHDRAPAVPEASPAAPEARSQSLRVSPDQQPGSRHS